MRRYETIFIVRPNIAEDEIDAVINRTSSIIEGDSGTIIKVDKWGLKKLAYLIKKESQGYYVYVDYAGMPASVSEVERIFRIDDKILKYLTVKLADSCDPEALKEELANAESAAETPAEDEVKEVESSDSDKENNAESTAEASAEDKVKEEESNDSAEEKND